MYLGHCQSSVQKTKQQITNNNTYISSHRILNDMETFVTVTKEVRKVQWALLIVNSVHLVVLATYIIGHIHRALCADVPGLCKPFPTNTVYLFTASGFDILSVVMIFISLLGVASSYLYATLGACITAIFCTMVVVILRSVYDATSLGEDASFNTFALILSWVLFAVNILKFFIFLVHNALYLKWGNFALSALTTAVGSKQVMEQLAKVPTKMNRSRNTLFTAMLLSFFGFILYLIMSLVFVWFPNSRNVLPSRSFYIVQVLNIPRIYDYVILLAGVGIPDLLEHNKAYGFLIMSVALYKTIQLASIFHMAFSALVTVIHAYTLFSNLNALSTFEAIWAGILLALAFSFFIINVISFFAATTYLSTIPVFFKGAQMRVMGRPLPRFPLKLHQTAEDYDDDDDSKQKNE